MVTNEPVIELRLSPEMEKLRSEWVDISSEQFRIYVFDNGDSIVIDEPQWLHISTGGHRIVDSNEVSYYVRYGWRCIRWVAFEGQPHFVR